MHVSPSPLRPLSENVSAPPRTYFRPVLALAFFAVLTMSGALALSSSGIAAPTPCGEDLAAACAVLK